MRETKDLLVIEPFYGGSHKKLVDVIITLANKHDISHDVLLLPAKKWHWKARTAALYLSTVIDKQTRYRTVFCSSVLNLCEMVGLNPELGDSVKLVYFHENQLVYPVRRREDGDFQFGYNQILTAIAADHVLFNSDFNRKSFLANIGTYLKLIPDHRPKGLENSLRPKCKVLYFPIETPPFAESIIVESAIPMRRDVLQIVWPHRWEFDKDPDTFFDVILRLSSGGHNFQLSVLGERFQDVPVIFEKAKSKLGVDCIRHWGYVSDKQTYFRLLRDCDVVVSTANHEFFGVAMLEAASCGCLPLCPNRLVYPEIFPISCLYNTSQQLFKKLKQYCARKELVKQHYDELNLDLDRFSLQSLAPTYLNHLKSEADP